MSTNNSDIKSRINAFKKKYFISLMLKGLIIALGLVLSIYFIINTLEYSFRFGSWVRASLLIVFITSALYAFGRFVIKPLYLLINHDMNDEEAAKRIGQFFPEVSDKLLNIIQLEKYEGAYDQSLQKAGILQKANFISRFEFAKAIDLSENKKYLKYVLIPALLVIAVLIISPTLLTSSTERIIKFNEEFIPEAPFMFHVENESLLAFKNEDFNLKLRLTGEAIPQSVYLLEGARKMKMQKVEDGLFSFSFKKIQNDKQVKFEAAGFNSSIQNIHVVSRPDLKNFNVYLNYPTYLNKKNTTLNNVGNLQIPEGTQVKWQLKTLESEEAAIKFTKSDALNPMQLSDDLIFEFEKKFKQSDTYSILLKNKYSDNKEQIIYKVDVIADQYPEINLNVYQDTTLYSYIALGGNIADDYGLRGLQLKYQLINEGKASDINTINISIGANQNSQRYYYQWMVDSLNINEGNSIKYWLEVSDNDAVNGSKKSKTGTYVFKIPTKREVKESIAEKSTRTENNIDKRLKEAKDLQKQIKEAENKLRGKKELNWQDQNLLKDIIKKKEELNQALEELKKQNEALNSKRDRFSQKDEQIAEKVEQLQKIMDDLLDEDTKKLYDELKKLLEEQQDIEQIQDVLNEMNKKEDNLEKELERTLELFKRMKFERDLSEAVNELKEQIDKQDRLIRETDNKPGEENAESDAKNQQNPEESVQKDNKTKSKNSEDLAKEQEQLEEDFKQFEESLEELKKQNQELKNPKSLPDTEEEQNQVKQKQQESKENLQNNRRKKSRDAQQQAKDQMQKMAEKLEQMQSSMQMNMMMENLDDLRDIMHNLIKLSFDQEELMGEFASVKQSDPRFVDLAQKQLRLKDDAKIVEDSLMSLAKRVFQIASFVTREVTDMNDHMDASVEAIKERKKPKATAEQQFAMTSMNNLALLLDDVLQQMQQAMSDAMGQGKPKPDEGSMSLSELQKQLNQQIEDLKKSGKSGRQLSEELAQLAAQQERIRKALQKMQQEMEGSENGVKPGQGIPEKMEETETDLVNKKITQETINRQKEILTRLLQAEDAMRERELDNKRKAETAKDYEKALPEAFEEYFKMKEKEVELLKTVPPKLYPYYKREVNNYFKRLENGKKE